VYTEDGVEYSTSFQFLPSNGVYVRNRLGSFLGRVKDKKKSVAYVANFKGDRTVGTITDKVLVDRIPTYMVEYINKYHTNCSSLAHFLTTGDFKECEFRNNQMVIQQNMRPISLATRIDVGDMVCVLYGFKRFLRSRRYGLRNMFLEAQKGHHKTGSFSTVTDVQQRIFTAEEIRELSKGFGISDYHFMVCVAKCHGIPVWLAQHAYTSPKDGAFPIDLTKGMRNPYTDMVPVFTFIKKRH